MRPSPQAVLSEILTVSALCLGTACNTQSQVTITATPYVSGAPLPNSGAAAADFGSHFNRGGHCWQCARQSRASDYPRRDDELPAPLR